MRRIAIINQKGGVGKTTTTANLGAALALQGRRVLVIDMDAQANLTLALGIEPDPSKPSSYSVLAGTAKSTRFMSNRLPLMVNGVPIIPPSRLKDRSVAPALARTDGATGSVGGGDAMAPGWAGKAGTLDDPRVLQQGPLPKDWAHYEGLYVNGDQVVLSYTVGGIKVLELPGVERDSIDVKATDRNLVISAERRAPLTSGQSPIKTRHGQTPRRLSDNISQWRWRPPCQPDGWPQALSSLIAAC